MEQHLNEEQHEKEVSNEEIIDLLRHERDYYQAENADACAPIIAEKLKVPAARVRKLSHKVFGPEAAAYEEKLAQERQDKMVVEKDSKGMMKVMIIAIILIVALSVAGYMFFQDRGLGSEHAVKVAPASGSRAK